MCIYVVVVVGINKAKFDDGHFLPHTQGFQFVGTILPFTLCWDCDTSKVTALNEHFGIIFALNISGVYEELSMISDSW